MEQACWRGWLLTVTARPTAAQRAPGTLIVSYPTVADSESRHHRVSCLFTVNSEKQFRDCRLLAACINQEPVNSTAPKSSQYRAIELRLPTAHSSASC